VCQPELRRQAFVVASLSTASFDVQHGVLAQRLVTQSLVYSVTHQQWSSENPFMLPAYVYRRNFADECLHQWSHALMELRKLVIYVEEEGLS
jgi:hypothetical protein